MKILLSNHHLLTYAGTEIYTYTLAKFLKISGHNVTIYSHYLGNIKSDFEKLGVEIYSDIEQLTSHHFDIAHVHHNINLFENRYHFPNLPIEN